jgi:hypothetical protein
VKRKPPALAGAPEPTVATEVRPEAEPERVDFHFPVEIHMEPREQALDLEKIAEHVLERLARRLT